MRIDLYGLSPGELERLMGEWEEPSFRAGQLCSWIHQRSECDPFCMTDLPEALRDKLASAFGDVSFKTWKRMSSRDGAVKFIFSLDDGAMVETVYLPSRKRNTICVSTQVGCPVGCPFCASGAQGFQRDLTAGEILAQVHAVFQGMGQKRGAWNLVFMGMGEPLLNEENLHRVLDVLFSPKGLDLGSRRVTVSTAGVLPGIERLAGRQAAPELAVSLHAATDAVRNRLVPLNKKYPIGPLLDAAENYADLAGTDAVTMEVLLLEGVNDGEKDAKALVRLLRGRPFKVNVIRHNSVSSNDYRPPSEAAVQRFLQSLRQGGIRATVRRSLGGEIHGGCGQLKASCQDPKAHFLR